MTAAAEFIDVHKSYQTGLLGRDARIAVSGVSLSIAAGEIIGLLGPNRAGKTTLVKLLLSLAHATSGEVRRLGRPVSDRSTLARVGYVHENHAFPKYLSPRKLLEYYGSLTLLAPDTVSQRIPELLRQVGLMDRADDPIRTFSKGMTQRLGLAQALINQPDLLVLDEPSEGLDIGGRGLILDVVRTCKDRGATVILVSHVLNEVEKLVDRVAVIVAGKLRQLGTVAEIAGGQSLEDSLRDLYSRTQS